MTLEFEPDGHVYRLDGREVPSVTQILSPYSGLQYVDRELLERAAAFGSHVHTACHLLNMDELDRSNLDPELEPYVAGWEKFLSDTGAVVVLSEHCVASKRGYAGKFDTLVHWGKSQRLIDIKTGSGIPMTVGPQTSAYVEAYAEETGIKVRDRYCVHLIGNGNYSACKLDDPRDLSIFHSALNIWNWFHKKRKAA